MSSSNGNGNGHTLAKRTTHREEEQSAESLMQLPPWLQSLRDAMGESIQGDDLKEIMQKQVEKAKTGCVTAAAFVMNQAHRMLQSEQKRVTVIQNNFYDTPEQRPDTPADSSPGSEKRIQKLSARAAAHMPLNGKDDPRVLTPGVVVVDDDEEEKELRRREAENDE